MKKIVDIPGSSGRTPFEASDEQYFYSTNYELSTLGGREMMPYADSKIFMMMGYTGLDWLLRIGLYDVESGVYHNYADQESKHFEPARYYVIGDQSPPTPSTVFFAGLAEAQEYLKKPNAADPSAVFVVARMLSSEDWH